MSTLRDDLAKLHPKQSRFTKAELTALLVRQGRHERDEQAARHLPLSLRLKPRPFSRWDYDEVDVPKHDEEQEAKAEAKEEKKVRGRRGWKKGKGGKTMKMRR